MRLFGLLALALGLVLLVIGRAGSSSNGSILSLLPGFDFPLRPIIYSVIGGVLVPVGYWAVRRGRRHGAQVLESIDTLRPDEKVVLFLRSFDDDEGFAQQQRGTQLDEVAGTTRTEEEQLSRALSPFGRMVALGRPADLLPQAGAARHYSSDEAWRGQVLAGLDRARLILLAAGPGEGLRWEVDQVVSRNQPERLIIIISRDAQQYQAFRASLGVRFPKGLPAYTPRSPLRAVAAAVYIRAAIWFDGDWTPHLQYMDCRDAEGDVGDWIESTFPRTMAHIYRQAGVSLPVRPGESLLRLLSACMYIAVPQLLKWYDFATNVGTVAGLRRRPRYLRTPSRSRTEDINEPVEVPGDPASWQALRVRTGGVDYILRVGNDVEEHFIEYRAVTGRRTVALLDGRPVCRGGRLVSCELPLGKGGATARLSVTDDPGIRLWVDGQLLYDLRSAAPDTDTFLEHQATAIREVLLASESLLVSPFPMKLHVAPCLHRRRRDMRWPGRS